MASADLCSRDVSITQKLPNKKVWLMDALNLYSKWLYRSNLILKELGDFTIII